MSQEYITFTIGSKKNIALIAHDNEKPKLIAWCKEHKAELEKHNLYGTGTTARMITDQTGLTVKGYNSGPLGGDQQIGAKIVEGVIDFVVFFSDPLTAQPHDPGCKSPDAYCTGLRHSHGGQQGHCGLHDYILFHEPGLSA